MYYVAHNNGVFCDIFLKEEHWKIEPYVPSPEPTPSEMDVSNNCFTIEEINMNPL